jgi:hypothetical protein
MAQIKTLLAKMLLQQMLCSFAILLLFFFPDPDCLSTRLTLEVEMSVLILEES